MFNSEGGSHAIGHGTYILVQLLLYTTTTTSLKGGGTSKVDSPGEEERASRQVGRAYRVRTFQWVDVRCPTTITTSGIKVPY